MGIIRAAAQPDPTKPANIDPGILDDSRLYPIASVACDRASAAGFDSLHTITSLMKSPQTAVLPDDPRYKIFQSMPPVTISDAQLATVAKVASPRIYRVVATGTAGRVKKKITAIIDTKARPGQSADQEPGRGAGGGRHPVLARGITRDHGPHHLRHRRRNVLGEVRFPRGRLPHPHLARSARDRGSGRRGAAAAAADGRRARGAGPGVVGGDAVPGGPWRSAVGARAGAAVLGFAQDRSGRRLRAGRADRPPDRGRRVRSPGRRPAA